MMPTCPHCKAAVKLSSTWQTREQLKRDEDNYICGNGHEFEAKTPLGIGKHGFAIRLDINGTHR